MASHYRLYPYAGEHHTVEIDEDNLPLLDAHRWSLTNCSRHTNAPKLYLRRRKYKGKKQVEVIYLHREIMGALPGVVVDHLDGNGLNCTRANMILTTQPENAKYHRQIHRKRK